VRVRDGFATIVERVRHSSHGFRIKRSRVKNGCDVDRGCLPVLYRRERNRSLSHQSLTQVRCR
jgi:hypothetical protein